MRELVLMYQADKVPNWINWWFPTDCPKSPYNPDRQLTKKFCWETVIEPVLRFAQ